MNKQTQKSIVLKRNFKNLMSTLLPMAKKAISQIKSNKIAYYAESTVKKETKCFKKGI